MFRLGVSSKVTVGYTILVAVLCIAAWLIYGNTNSFMKINKAEQAFMERRGTADSLVYCILDISNNERAIYLGMYDRWGGFSNSIDRAVSIADSLKTIVGDPVQRKRIDTLKRLLRYKRENTLKVMSAMGADSSEVFFRNKVDSLHGGKDSVIIQPKTVAVKEDKEIVYEVVKRKKGFFSRIADAFKGSKSDTVSVRHNTKKLVSDSARSNVNIADTVADLISDIKKEADRRNLSRKQTLVRRERAQQSVSVELARRIEQIMKDIRSEEYRSLQTALKNDIEARRGIMGKIVFLALVSVVTALILMLYISRDIRRDRRYRHSLETAKAETERLLQQRERLLLTITHDIKAPAASISGFIELLGELVSGPKATTYLKNIRSSATHLHHLVSALLDYHQLEKGKVAPRIVSFSAEQLVESCAEEMSPQAGAKGLELVCRTEGCRDRMCRSDAFRIRQILENLISNAIKYTDSGSVTVSATLADNLLRLRVADTGQGMTPEESSRVFDAFTRLPGAQGIEGVGLGLSITREIVALLNGTVKLYSTKGKGTTFDITIPVKSYVQNGVQTPDPQNTADTEIPVTTNQDIPKTMKILIIDDDRLQLQILREMLSRLGQGRWDITVCQHVREGLDLLGQGGYSVLITDLEMPEMNGFQIIRSIDHTGIAVIAMTAHEKSIEPDLREAGFDGCLFKPFTIEKLAQTIAAATSHAEPASQANDKPQTCPPDDYGRFSPLTAFAADDREAALEILHSFDSELSSHIDCLDKATATLDRKEIGRIAHKALPMLDMVKAPCTDILKRMSPEHIGELDDDTLTDCCRKTAAAMSAVKGELDDILARLKD